MRKKRIFVYVYIATLISSPWPIDCFLCRSFRETRLEYCVDVRGKRNELGTENIEDEEIEGEEEDENRVLSCLTILIFLLTISKKRKSECLPSPKIFAVNTYTPTCTNVRTLCEVKKTTPKKI